MTVQTSVKLPEDLRARLDRAAAPLARDHSALIVDALMNKYLAELMSEEEDRRQCEAADAADADEDSEAFVEWPRD